jgi:TP901 family phage tail tape measure protein
MAAFNLTAEINLRGPSNLNQVVSNIKRQLSTVSLNLNINPSAARGIQAATAQLQGLNNALQLATANANSLNAALANLGTSIGNAARGMNTLGGGLNNVNNQINAVQRNTQQGAAGMEEFGRQAALAVRRFAAFSVATGGIYALVRAISSGYSEFLQFNKELVRLQQVTGGTANSLQGISNEITRLATSLGVTSSELLTVSSTLAQAGLSATETKTSLEALAKSALAPSFDNLNDTVEGSIALMRQFGISANDLEGSLGSINSVAAAFAVESGDIIKAIQRTGGVFAAASKGVTEGKDALNEFVAVFTSVRQTTRESAETIATGLRTIFTRIQRGGTIQALKEYGIVLTDLEGKFVGPFEAVRRLSEGLKQLDPRDLRFSKIVEELGGFRQIGKVIPLIQQFATAQQALTVAQRGAGSLAEAAATAQGSLAIKITKVREEFIALIRDIGQSDSFQKFVDISLQLASALISVASAAKNVLPALAALAAIRSIPAIGQFVGGFGRGLTRRNQGGPIRAFARGGFVPGSGNSDTVPAMLTPGEFVIRKNAVKSIGVNRLQKMNKYAGGGPVRLKDLEARSGSATIKNAYSSTIQPSDKISANVNRKPQQVKPNDPRWENIQSIAKKRYAQLRAKNPKASDKKLKDIATGDAFEDSIAKSTGGQKTSPSYPVDIIGKKNAIEAKFTSKKTPIMDLISKLFRYRYEQNTLGRYDFTPGVDPNVNIGSLDVMEMGSGQKKQFMRLYKFNAGGTVQKFANGGQPIREKMTREERILKGMKGKQTYNFGVAALRAGAGTKEDVSFFGSPKSGQLSQTFTEPFDIPGTPPKKGQFFIGTLSTKGLDNTIESVLKQGTSEAVISAANILGNQIGTKPISTKSSLNRIFKGSGFQSVIGSGLEAATAMVSSGPYIDKTESTKSFDFPLGLGSAGPTLFGIPGDIPTDATRTIGGFGKSRSKLKNSAISFVQAVEGGEFTKARMEKAASRSVGKMQKMGIAQNILPQIPQGFNSSATAFQIKQKYGLSRSALTSRGFPLALETVAKTGKEKEFLTDIQNALGMPTVKRNANGGAIQKFAKGGSPEDTVPALLTPGEFVINKKAAQRIGSAKLNRLNKADKIQGFNKGGVVGRVQSFASGGGVQEFAVGGIVSAMTSLVKSLPQLASAVANSVNRMRGIPRNIPQGGGWTTATGRAAPLPGRDTEGGGMMGTMGLMFIGPMIAEAINSAVSKNFGQTGAVAGSVITSGISGATIGSIAGPWGALAGAAVGLASGFLNMESAANAYIKAQNELKIETESSKLEQSLTNLASKANVTAEDLLAIGSSVTEIVSLASSNRAIIQQEAGGGTLGWLQRTLMSNFGGGQLDTAQISRELLASSQASTSAIERSLQFGSGKGLMTQQALQQQGININEDTPEAKEIKRSLALLQGGAEVTKLEARRIQVAEDVTLDEEGKAAILRAIDQNITNTIDRLSQEYIKNRDAIIQSQAAVKAVTADVDLFAQTIKRLGAFINRGSAEFDEAGRQREIATSAGLGEARIVGPSRLDENILSNPIAFSVEELTKALDRTSKTLGFSPELTQKVKTSAVAQQTLESELPRILLQAAKTQQIPGGEFDVSINDQLDEVFKPIREALGGEVDAELLDKYLKDIVTNLQKSAMSLQGKNFEEIASSVPEFAQILKPLSEITQGVGSSLKAYNDMLASTNTEMNNFTNHIGRILDLQMQAASIQLEGANNLKQALGESLSVSQLNKPFDTMIETLTSTQGPNGLVRGTGTLDPAEIARRLSQADKELADAQRGGQKPDETLDDFYNRITNAKTTVDKLSKAQEMLANNTTKASNALNRIRELRQAQENRRNTFDDVLRNINNPQWLMNFTDQVRSLERVQSGRGTMRDIPGAIDALEKRIAGMDPQKQKAEREKFYNNIAEILRKAGVDPTVIKDIRGMIGVGGPDAKINEAISQYNEAIKAQADATLFMADRMELSSYIFFNKIIEAAELFLKRVREGAQDLRPPPGMGVDNNPIGGVVASTGGLIYANKGRLVDFKPKGSDTVPAMLTPGEFVVNAKSTKKNIGLLKAINGNTQSAGMSKGGVVYLQDGGQVEKSKKLFGELMASSEGNSGYYSELSPKAIFKDLRATGERPLGYSTLSTEDASLVDMAIDNFISTYEKNRTSGIDAEREQIRQDRADSAAALTKIKMDELKEAINAGIVSETGIGATLGPDGYDLSTARSLTVDERAKLRQSKLDKQSSEIDRLALIRQQESQRLLNELSQQKEEARSREELNAKAKLETNPLTNKPYSSLNEKEAVEARVAHDEKVKAQAQQIERQKLEERRRRFPDVPWAEPKTAADIASIEAGTNPGARKAADAIEYFKNDPMFKDYRYDPYLVERIEGIIRDKYGDDLSYERKKSVISGRELPPVSPDQLLSLVRRSSLDYWANIGRRQDAMAKSQQDFANKNMQIALQQFGEGVDKSPILSAVTAVPKNVANVGRTAIGGAAIVGGAITQGAGKLTGNDFVEELGKNIVTSGSNQAGMGVEGMRQVGAGLGSRLGFGEAYGTAEQEAMKRREALISQEVARAQGAYSTDNTTTLGNLLTPENVVRGAITTGDIFGEAAGDIGGEKLFGRLFPTAFKGLGKSARPTTPIKTRVSANLFDDTNVKFPIGASSDIATRTTVGEGTNFANMTANLSDYKASVEFGEAVGRVGSVAKKGFFGGVDLAERGLAGLQDFGLKSILKTGSVVGNTVSGATKNTLGILKGLPEMAIDNLTGSSGLTQQILNSGKGMLGKPFEMVGDMLRNRSTKKWFSDLQQQQKLSQNPLEDLVKSGPNKKIGKTTQPLRETPQPQKPFKPQEEVFDIGNDVPDEVNKSFIDGKWVSDDEYSKILAEKTLQEQSKKMVVTGTTSPKIVEKTREAVLRAQKKVRDIMARYASSPEKAEEIMRRQSELFDIQGVDIDPNLKSKVNVLTGKEAGVGGEYRYATKRIGLPTSESISSKAILEHETLHGVQMNLARMRGAKDKYKWLRPDSLKDLQPQIDEFVKPGGSYEKLVKDLGGNLGGAGFYSPKQISDNHFELLTTLGMSADTKAFKNNQEAQDMLRAVIKAMGYNKGGMIYASNGTLVPYQSRGTDTVPAMLTPGEFVVNAKATKKNLGLLKAINGGAKGYSKGGMAYLEEGGIAGAINTPLPDDIKSAIDDIKKYQSLLLEATSLDAATIARNIFQTALDKLSSSGYAIDTSGLQDILQSPEEKLLESIRNNNAALQQFYDQKVASINTAEPQASDQTQTQQSLYGPALPPVPPSRDDLTAIGSFVGGGLGQLRLPVLGAEAPEEDPYSGMNQRQKMLAMRKAEYEVSQQAKREAFRTRTGRDPNTGRIGGPKVALTPEQKAQNKRRAEIRAAREGLELKQDAINNPFDPIFNDVETKRKYNEQFEATLSPEQLANRRRAERLAAGAVDPKNRTDGGARYDILKDKFLEGLSPEQMANRERAEKMALDALRPENRSSEQQERLDILKTAIDQRSPEQIARLEELRKEKEQALYASKGRLINYQPRGTDTVPAMLTPGEFVVNRKATKNNLSLLKTINSGNYNTGGIVNPLYLRNGTDSSSGGSPVSLNGVSIPLDTGSFDGGVDRFGSSVDLLSNSISQFVSGGADIANALAGFSNVANAFTALSSASALLSGTASGLTNAISLFNTSVSRMNESLSGIPDTISLNVTGSIPVNVTVTVNGGEGLDEKLSSFEDAIYNQIASEVARATAGRNQIKLNFTTSRK